MRVNASPMGKDSNKVRLKSSLKFNFYTLNHRITYNVARLFDFINKNQKVILVLKGKLHIKLVNVI